METPRKFIIAKLSIEKKRRYELTDRSFAIINLRGVSTKLNWYHISFSEVLLTLSSSDHSLKGSNVCFENYGL